MVHVVALPFLDRNWGAPSSTTTTDPSIWFNHRRLLEPIGNIPPAEAEARYYAQLEEPALAA
jgi:hypothetical protein